MSPRRVSLAVAFTFAALPFAACGFIPSPFYPAANTLANAGANAGANAVVQSQNRPQNAPQSAAVPPNLQSLGNHMGQVGYQPVGPAVRNNNLPTNGMSAYAIDTQLGKCYSVVALGDPNTDVDLVLLDPQGRTAAHNVTPDSHPFVTFCPRQAGRFVARVQMSQGSGGYYFISFVGPANSSPQLARYFRDTDGGGGTQVAQTTQSATPAQATLDPTTQARVLRMDRQLSRDDFTRVSDPYGLVLSERQDRQFPLNLEAGYCYAFAAFGGAGTNDTDIYVIDGSGNELVHDSQTDRDALVRFCPNSAGAYNLKVRLYTGNGPVFVSGWVQANPNAATTTTVANNTTATPTPTPTPATNVISQESTEGAGLDENFRLLQADMVARGYEAYGQATRGALGEGASRDFQVNLEGDKCYAILAVGDNGVRNLDLLVEDRTGRTLDRDTAADARPIVRTCPTASGQQTIKVRMTAGSGDFYYAAYRWPRGTSGPFGIQGVQWVRLGELTSLLRVESYEPSTDIMTLNDRGRLASQGATVTKHVQLAASHCYAIAVVGDVGITNLDVKLKSGRNVVAQDSSSSAFPNVRVCTQTAGTYDLAVTAAGGSGTFVYEVFERSRN